ncbi:MAG: hypothetical protein J6X66_13655 [Lachnospiraceae bacterium]|nr:hypothetical protein [Lachnospiraceae bacterium]
MAGLYGKKKYKNIILVLGLLVLISMLFSVCLACAEKHHHCMGEDCPICACINQCRESLRDLTDGIVPFVLVFTAAAAVYGLNRFPASVCIGDTPVDLRVRLND